QPLAPAPPRLSLRILLLAPQLDPVPVREHLHRAPEVERLGRLHEADRVARLPAAEAVVELVLGVDGERRRALVVEPAQPDPARAPRANPRTTAWNARPTPWRPPWPRPAGRSPRPSSAPLTPSGRGGPRRPPPAADTRRSPSPSSPPPGCGRPGPRTARAGS